MLTEQQILDKTIEYLNKYSSFFQGWRYFKNLDEIFAYDNNEEKAYGILEIKNALTGGIDITAFKDHYSRFQLVMYSEFFIAYNIIKDFSTAQ